VKNRNKKTNYLKKYRINRNKKAISPYLFVMSMDKLSHLIFEATDMGNSNAWRARKRDDLLLFGQANEGSKE